MKTITFLLAFFISILGYSTDYPFTVNGKQYKIVTTQKSWVDAAAWAVADGGYLVHINSQTEQDSIWAAIQSSGISTTYTVVNDGGGIAYIWIGASDAITEGTWIWDGDNDGNGTNFYTGQGQWGAGNGASVGNAYINWGGTSSSGGASTKEPDNYADIQDAAAIGLESWPMGTGTNGGGIGSEWNDISATNTLYFIVEYETVGLLNLKPKNKPNIKVLQWGNKKVSLKAESQIEYTKIYSTTGMEIINSQRLNATEIVFILPKNGIYFYRSKLRNGTFSSGRFLIL